MFDIPHGLVCGILMAPANEITVRELRKSNLKSEALKKYVQLGKIFADKENKSDGFYIDGFIEHLFELSAFFRFPKLREFGINEKDVLSICRVTDNKNNPVKLSLENLTEIVRKVL